jgi:hypothetical protein
VWRFDRRNHYGVSVYYLPIYLSSCLTLFRICFWAFPDPDE